MIKSFKEVTLQHIPHAENTHVDQLFKLTKGKDRGQLKMIT